MFYIALKDLMRSLRSPFTLAFMLILPLLEAGLPYLAFSNLSSGLPVQTTRVLLVNLDRPVEQYPDFLAGNLLADMFRNDELGDLLDTTVGDSEAAARAAVDSRETDVAVIIPSGLTAALFGGEGRTEIEIYHDPALTLGPAVVRDVVTNFLDGFAGSLIAADTAARRAAEDGALLDDNSRLEIMRRYGDWAQGVGESLGQGIHPAVRYEASARVQPSESVMKAQIGPIMLGMLVFFAFFTGAISAQSLLHEAEQGTLARLFRTPASKTAILTGKFATVEILLALQVILLIGIGKALFGIAWGDPILVILNGSALVVAAGGFGIMLIAFMRTTRQAFLVMGGAVILTGMAGGTMTTWFVNPPALFETVNLFTPQGWILRGFSAAMRGGGTIEAAVPAAVGTGLGLIFLWIGVHKLKAKFA
ncbi:MAG: ABC transporter permease [Anaerolineales bacterium]|nr:ABC transporter permease [Anaerolineales bacterium]